MKPGYPGFEAQKTQPAIWEKPGFKPDPGKLGSFTSSIPIRVSPNPKV